MNQEIARKVLSSPGKTFRFERPVVFDHIFGDRLGTVVTIDRIDCLTDGEGRDVFRVSTHESGLLPLDRFDEGEQRLIASAIKREENEEALAGLLRENGGFIKLPYDIDIEVTDDYARTSIEILCSLTGGRNGEPIRVQTVRNHEYPIELLTNEEVTEITNIFI